MRTWRYSRWDGTQESFALDDDNEDAASASDGGSVVRSRSRASRVRGGALRTAQP